MGTVRSANGAMFTGATVDFHAYPMLVQGYYDWRNWAIAQLFVPVGGTIVEVGANVGTETVCFGKVVGSTGRVIAFEPVPSNVDWLHRNCDLNPDLTIDVLALALSDEDGSIRFEVPPSDISGQGYLVQAGDTIDDEQERRARGWTQAVVSVRRFDDLALGIDRLDLMALDVEGAEPLVLRGAAQAIERHRPTIIVEADGHHLRRAGFDGLQELRACIQGFGYRPFAIQRHEVAPLTDDMLASGASNWLCLPEEKATDASRVSAHLRRCLLAPIVPGLSPLARSAT